MVEEAYSLEKIVCDNFFDTAPAFPPAKSVVFAGWRAASLRPGPVSHSRHAADAIEPWAQAVDIARPMSRFRSCPRFLLALLLGTCVAFGSLSGGLAAAADAAPAKPAAKPATKPATAPPPTSPSKAKPPAAKPGTAAARQKSVPARLKQKPGEVMEVDWKDLLPADERAHYSAAAPPPVHGPLGEGGPPAVQKQTTTLNDELGELNVHMPGFVVPIGAPRNGIIREFFLVPYIGACIHVPPPPPNQMVYVMSASGIAADAIHEAYWVTGKMRIENRTTPLGNSAYALNASKVELYQYGTP